MNYEEEIKTNMVLYHPSENPTILLMRGQVDSEIVFYDNYREILHKMLDDAIDEFMGFKGKLRHKRRTNTAMLNNTKHLVL